MKLHRFPTTSTNTSTSQLSLATFFKPVANNTTVKMSDSDRETKPFKFVTGMF